MGSRTARPSVRGIAYCATVSACQRPAGSAGLTAFMSDATRAIGPDGITHCAAVRVGAAVSAREMGRRFQQALHLGRATQRRRAGGAQGLRVVKACGKRPAAPAGLLSLTRVAVPFPRPGRDHLRRIRQGVREGPAVSAGLMFLRTRQGQAFVPGAATDSAAVRARKAGPAGSAGRTYLTCDAAASCRWRPRTLQPSVRAERSCSVSRPQLLGSPQHLAVVPGVISCGAAVRACGKGPRDPQASQLLRAMQRQVTVPKGTTCWAAVSACEKAQPCRQALLLSRVVQHQAIVPVAFPHEAAVGLPQAGSCNAAPCLTARRVHARGGRHRGRRRSRALAYPTPRAGVTWMLWSCSSARS